MQVIASLSRPEARFIAVVVFPTPSLWFTIDIIGIANSCYILFG